MNSHIGREYFIENTPKKNGLQSRNWHTPSEFDELCDSRTSPIGNDKIKLAFSSMKFFLTNPHSMYGMKEPVVKRPKVYVDHALP